MNYRIKRFDVISVASIGALLYAGVALFFALVLFLFSSMIATAMGHLATPFPFPFLMMGPLMIVIFPVFYGIFAFVALAIITLLYNLFAGLTGGICITLQPDSAQAGTSPQTLA